MTTTGTTTDPLDAALADVEAEKRAQQADRIRDRLERLDDHITMLKAMGVEVKLVLTDSTEEQLEIVEIGKSDWRQRLLLPRDMDPVARQTYIEERATGAAKAFAAALACIPYEPKGKKGE